MEDSGEVHSEENRVSSEKNLKRTVKTPAQVIELENFYNEHKYPTEEMKSEVAERIGLTEKQISSWFCHRRLKDKRSRDEGCANGRQDRSSGIIQDRGSGLRQDSCGSTKQGDYKHLDPREVESQSLHGQDFVTADLTYDRTSRYTGNISGIDNISAGSSSSLQEKFVSQREDPYDTETSKHRAQNGAIMPSIPKGSDSFGYRPSGYLKVKGEIENAAITAVKMQLGRHYREDGPPLGVEFQPLPPGAFASPSRDPVNGPIYVGDLARMHSPDVSGVQKQPSLSTRCETYSSKRSSHDSYMEGLICNPENGSDSHDRKPLQHLEQKSTYNGSNSNAGGKSVMDMYDDLAVETSAYRNKRNYKLGCKHGFEGRTSDYISAHHGPSGRRINSEQTEGWLHDYDNGDPKITHRNDYFSKTSHLIVGSGKSLHTEERAPCTMMAKEEKLYRQLSRTKGSHDSVRVKRHPADAIAVVKRCRVDFPQQENGTKASFSNVHRKTNMTKGPVMERPSSFSEDETAETSSSAE